MFNETEFDLLAYWDPVFGRNETRFSPLQADEATIELESELENGTNWLDNDTMKFWEKLLKQEAKSRNLDTPEDVQGQEQASDRQISPQSDVINQGYVDILFRR